MSFSVLGGQFPSKFDIVIPKTPLYKGIVVYCHMIALWEGVVVLKELRQRMVPLHVSKGIPMTSQYTTNFSLTVADVENHHF